MASKEHPGTQIRRLLAETGIITVPGAYDALTARLIEDAGFPVVYATGAGMSNTQLGLADKGLLSFAEVAQQVGRIVEAVDVPVIVDADTGYGGARQRHPDRQGARPARRRGDSTGGSGLSEAVRTFRRQNRDPAGGDDGKGPGGA